MAYHQTFVKEIYEKKMVADCHTVAPHRGNWPMVHEKPGRWSRKAGGRYLQCSFCIQLSAHEKAVTGRRWSLFTVVAKARFDCTSMHLHPTACNW